MGEQMKKHYWLYVLSLEERKHYVGITTKTPEKRFQEHLEGVQPAYWTIKYRPLDILDAKDLGMMKKKDAEAFENKVIRKYIKKYGDNNARGGDLRDTEDYRIIFGHIYDAERLSTLFGIIIMSLAFISLLTLYLLK